MDVLLRVGEATIASVQLLPTTSTTYVSSMHNETKQLSAAWSAWPSEYIYIYIYIYTHTR